MDGEKISLLGNISEILTALLMIASEIELEIIEMSSMRFIFHEVRQVK